MSVDAAIEYYIRPALSAADERERRASREKNAAIFSHHCSGLRRAICYSRLPKLSDCSAVGGLKRSRDVSCMGRERNHLIFVEKEITKIVFPLTGGSGQL